MNAVDRMFVSGESQQNGPVFSTLELNEMESFNIFTEHESVEARMMLPPG